VTQPRARRYHEQWILQTLGEMPADYSQGHLPAGLVEIACDERPAAAILQTAVDRDGVQREAIGGSNTRG
jgi:hypothetical protein